MLVLQRIICGAFLSAVLATRAFRKRSLNTAGAIAAFAVGSVAFAASVRQGVILLTFYYSSTILTKQKLQKKKRYVTEYDQGTARSLEQVLGTSTVGTLLALVQLLCNVEDGEISSEIVPWRTFLLCSYLGHYACCNGDTWASELGILSTQEPVLITSFPRWRRVPRGTNGGISVLGTFASTLGGGLIGLMFYLCGLLFNQNEMNLKTQELVILLGLMGGFCGSCLDSLLGSCLQETWYDSTTQKVVARPEKPNNKVVRICGRDILTNEQVNLVSGILISFMSGGLGLLIM